MPDAQSATLWVAVKRARMGALSSENKERSRTVKTLKIKKGLPMTMDEGDQPSFEQWMERVDRFVQLACSVSVHDLVDQPYRDWFDARLRPVRAANRAIRGN